jgi:hypothetical protein
MLWYPGQNEKLVVSCSFRGALGGMLDIFRQRKEPAEGNVLCPQPATREQTTEKHNQTPLQLPKLINNNDQ